jgi:hypothetical protein
MFILVQTIVRDSLTGLGLTAGCEGICYQYEAIKRARLSWRPLPERLSLGCGECLHDEKSWLRVQFNLYHSAGASCDETRPTERHVQPFGHAI